jgi:DNA replication protein DnaC
MGEPQRVAGVDVLAALPRLPEKVRERIAAGALEHAEDSSRVETEQEAAERVHRQREGSRREALERRTRFFATVPERFLEATLAGLSPEQDPQGKVSGWLGWGGASTLLIVGAVGAGKSHAAYAVARSAVDAGLWVEAGDAAGLIDAVRQDTLEGVVLDRLCRCDVLLVDDIGVERVNEFAAEVMQRIVDARWRGVRRTIVTSNLSAAEIERRYGVRLVDRLLDGAVVADYRALPSRRA